MFDCLRLIHPISSRINLCKQLHTLICLLPHLIIYGYSVNMLIHVFTFPSIINLPVCKYLIHFLTLLCIAHDLDHLLSFTESPAPAPGLSIQ